jgi:hypothetical protein
MDKRYNGADGPAARAGAEVFGDPDRLRVTLWVYREISHAGAVFTVDRCAVPLGLPEAVVRRALEHLQRGGLIGYLGGLYSRLDHPLWTVVGALDVYSRSAGGRKIRQANAPEPLPAAVFYG